MKLRFYGKMLIDSAILERALSFIRLDLKQQLFNSQNNELKPNTEPLHTGEACGSHSSKHTLRPVTFLMDRY